MKTPEENIQVYNETDSTSSDSESRAKHTRKRKTSEQVKSLKREFRENPNWGKRKVNELSRELNLTEPQVYKWAWDYKKKIQSIPQEKPLSFLCNETLHPTDLETNIWQQQHVYRSLICSLPSYNP